MVNEAFREIDEDARSDRDTASPGRQGESTCSIGTKVFLSLHTYQDINSNAASEDQRFKNYPTFRLEDSRFSANLF